MNPNLKHTARLEGLQVLRGMAALLVMWCHLKYNLGVSPAEFSNVPVLATDLGAIGVDIFFVISGFVIAMTAANLGNNWREFLAHRTARVVPLYFALSTGMLILVLAGLDVTNAPGDSGRLSFGQIFNTYAFLPAFDTATFTNPLCVNGWTLSFEIWFYLCFACLMKFFNGNRAGQVLPFFMTAGVMVTAACYHSNHWFLPKFLFHPLTLEFCAGCVLFHVRDHMGRVTLFVMVFVGLGFLYVANQAQFLGVHWAVLNNQALGFYRAEIWGGFAVCLVGAMTQMDLKYPRRWPKFLLLLGDASYSLYLVAPLVMLTVNAMMLGISKWTGFAPPTMPLFVSGMIYVLGTILGGIALWKFFEIPTTRKVKKLLMRFVPKTI